MICLTVANVLLGCHPVRTTATSTTPDVEVSVVTASPLTDTPVPACVVLSDIELSVDILPESSVHIKITGLVPHETVYAIFSSKNKSQTSELSVHGPADEKGVFEYSVGLRGLETAPEFKDWQIRVVHSRGSTCAEISLP